MTAVLLGRGCDILLATRRNIKDKRHIGEFMRVRDIAETLYFLESVTTGTTLNLSEWVGQHTPMLTCCYVSRINGLVQ